MVLLDNNWFQTFSQFRVNPESFFDKRQLTREAFCLDMLKDVYSDDIDPQYKIHILMLLQEYSTLLITDFNLLEQIVGSLENLFKILKATSENRLLKSQVLITISTVLLTADVENDTTALITNLKELLLNVIANVSDDCVVISSACKCLEEIELSFPNTLQLQVQNILTSCEKQLSPAFQNYVTLLSLCMKHICSSFLEKSAKVKDEVIETNDGLKLSNVLSYLMELVPLMSSMSAYRVLKNLIYVVKQSHISSVVFKLYLPSLIFSSEVQLVHLSYELLESFHDELFTAQEEKSLLRQLILLSTHPCLTISHRMLFLDWLKNILLNKDIFSCPFPMYKCLLPGPFDGPVTQEKKCYVISLFLPQNIENGQELLDESVNGLKKCALLPHGTKFAASFFRTLFVFLSYHKSEHIQDYIYKLLLNTMKTCPHLLKYALSFLDSVKMEFPESDLPKNVFTHLVDHILSLPVKQFSNNLECYLAILEQASEICGSACKPRSILRLLQKLLAESEFGISNKWEFGNDILSVCRSILKFHDVQIFYYDLAEVLCLIAQHVEDVDVKDRAKMYYSILTTLSKLKVQSIFKNQSPPEDLNTTLTSLVPGVNPNLQFIPSVRVLTKSVLQLVRIKKNWEFTVDENDLLPAMDDDIFEIFQEHLSSLNATIQVPFVLKHTADSEDAFNNLYGIVISTYSSSICNEVPDVEIPVFKFSDRNEENILHIDIRPILCQPAELQFRIRFTCNNGFNYICHPNSVFLNFKDFFLPLPVPLNFKKCSSSWRKKIFEILWEKFESRTSKKYNESKCCKSALCLRNNKEEMCRIIEEHWRQFIVSKFDDCVCWIAIFLPPKQHLLLKTNIINEKPFVHILVDDVSILPWTALYLQEIINKVPT